MELIENSENSKLTENISYIYTSIDEPILSENEQAQIVEWVTKNYHRLKSPGHNRYMNQLDLLPDAPSCIWDIKKRIVDKENLHNAIQEPLFRDAIGYMIEGGQLHRHTDSNKGSLVHTRFNVYVQLPKKGGRPIYDETLCNLKERTYICCRSGIDFHHCELVEGDRARIVVSFGYLLPYERIKNVKYEYS